MKNSLQIELDQMSKKRSVTCCVYLFRNDTESILDVHIFDFEKIKQENCIVSAVYQDETQLE